jgi:hypothetical protein
VGVFLGEHAFEEGLSRSMASHGVVDRLADGGLLGFGLEVRPAGFLGHPEDVTARYSSGSSGSAPLLSARLRAGVLPSKAVGDVLEEDQAEDDMLVLAASMLERSASAACQS